MYVQAFGEYLFADALHVVPTAWNAHMLAVFALDCVFVALAVAVVYGWTRSVAGAAACFAVFTGFAIAYPPIVNSDWMPYMYVLAYMVFVVAAGSLAAGRAQDAWIFALTGWFLIHGHACFLFFVPVISLAVIAAVLWPHRRTLRASVRSFFRERRGVWIPVAVISAIFALPIVVNLVLHWPGDFGKYLSYSSSGRAGGHGLRQVTRYALWFWWPHEHTWVAGLVPVAGYALAIAVTVWLSRGPLRRLLLALLAVNVVSSLAFLFYATVGIDDLTEYYIGYFYWSAPLVTVLVVVLGAVGAIRARLGACVAGVVATLAARAPGQLIVLHIDHDAWVETTGFLVQAERAGVKACLDYPRLEFMMTGQFICTPAQVASGRGYWFYVPDSIPPGAHVIIRFSRVAVVPVSS
jgi:hypothetical protein